MISVPENWKRKIVVCSASETRISSKAKRSRFSLKANGAFWCVFIFLVKQLLYTRVKGSYLTCYGLFGSLEREESRGE